MKNYGGRIGCYLSGLYAGYFMREPRNYRKLWIPSWILKLWILSRRHFSRIVAISVTIIFLPPMFAPLYFYSFHNPPPPLLHFHCFPSTTTTTTTRNTPYPRNLLLCISLIINKQRRKIKNVVSPALIIQHANTSSDVICSVSQRTVLLFSFVRNVVNYNAVFFS